MKTYKSAYEIVKDAMNSGKVRNIFDLIDGAYIDKNRFEYSEIADVIFNLAAKYADGFVVDICKRVLESSTGKMNIVLTDKQSWCVAYAVMKLDVSLVDELQKADLALIEEFEKTDIDMEMKENNTGILIIEDIRMVNEYQESGRVFIHLKNGKTIRRTMRSNDVRRAQIIRNKEGIDAFHREICRLFNEQYFEPDKPIKLSAEDERFLELRNKKKICGFLDPDQERELEKLMD